MNIEFCDGHVKWEPQTTLLQMGYTMPFAGYQNGVNNGWHHNGVLDMTVNQ